jgi:hypothetical protein
VDASVRQFCANAYARFHACEDFDAKQQFLTDHIERVAYDRYKVTVMGSVPVQTAPGQTKLHFRIRSEININKIRSQSFRKTALQMIRTLEAETSAATEAEPVPSPIAANPEIVV